MMIILRQTTLRLIHLAVTERAFQIQYKILEILYSPQEIQSFTAEC
jgi:hypothetical protein